MKYLLIYAIAVLIACCNSSNPDRVRQVIQDQSKAMAALQPGTVGTTAGGYEMSATLNGKKWSAVSMMPPEVSSRIVGYSGDDYVGLPYSEGRYEPGKKQSLGPDNAVDILFQNDEGLWLTSSGTIETLSNNGKWIEAKFTASFNDKLSGKTMSLTDGFFRIPARER